MALDPDRNHDNNAQNLRGCDEIREDELNQKK